MAASDLSSFSFLLLLLLFHLCLVLDVTYLIHTRISVRSEVLVVNRMTYDSEALYFIIVIGE